MSESFVQAILIAIIASAGTYFTARLLQRKTMADASAAISQSGVKLSDAAMRLRQISEDDAAMLRKENAELRERLDAMEVNVARLEYRIDDLQRLNAAYHAGIRTLINQLQKLKATPEFDTGQLRPFVQQ
jgi:phage shock protein A